MVSRRNGLGASGRGIKDVHDRDLDYSTICLSGSTVSEPSPRFDRLGRTYRAPALLPSDTIRFRTAHVVLRHVGDCREGSERFLFPVCWDRDSHANRSAYGQEETSNGVMHFGGSRLRSGGQSRADSFPLARAFWLRRRLRKVLVSVNEERQLCLCRSLGCGTQNGGRNGMLAVVVGKTRLGTREVGFEVMG